MKKRYEIYRNGEFLGEADTNLEIYKMINATKQYYHKSIKVKLYADGVNYKGDRYTSIDRLNPKV